MNQDLLINWLYNHFDVEEFLRAKQRGGAFAYLANVSQQILGQTGNNPQPRATARVRPPATETMDAQDIEPQRVQRRANPTPAVQDLNAATETATPAPAPAPRRQPARAVANEGDRVRVATL